MITGISKRNNYINRQSPANKHQHHIIASNLDQSLLLATLKNPKTSQGFIDRFLVAGEAYHIHSVIVFNKSDIYRKKEEEDFEERKAMYEAAGYKVLRMSLENKTGMEEVEEILRNKTTLLSGHSGVGKSTFINAVVAGMELKTQGVSGWSGKGMHTTTFAEMYDLPVLNAHVIDTPGIREFGLVIFPRDSPITSRRCSAKAEDCQFNNCLHINEPGCAIKKALNEGKLSLVRYISYCMMLDSIQEKTY
jgi:ribosome biogenesis GTPase